MPIPAAADLIASTTPYVTDLFTLMLPWALAVTGLVLAGVLVGYLVGALKGGISKVIGRGRKTSGRRGRRGR